MASRTTPPRQAKTILSYPAAMPYHCLEAAKYRSIPLRRLSASLSKPGGRPQRIPIAFHVPSPMKRRWYFHTVFHEPKPSGRSRPGGPVDEAIKGSIRPHSVSDKAAVGDIQTYIQSAEHHRNQFGDTPPGAAARTHGIRTADAELAFDVYAVKVPGAHAPVVRMRPDRYRPILGVA